MLCSLESWAGTRSHRESESSSLPLSSFHPGCLPSARASQIHPKPPEMAIPPSLLGARALTLSAWPCALVWTDTRESPPQAPGVRLESFGQDSLGSWALQVLCRAGRGRPRCAWTCFFGPADALSRGRDTARERAEQDTPEQLKAQKQGHRLPSL